MTIFEQVENALDTLNIPFANGRYIPATGEQLPDLFIVYTLISDYPAQHADDTETIAAGRVQISIFSRSGLVGLPDVKGAMIAAGFMRSNARQLAFNQETRHFGIAMDFIFMESE